MAHTDALADLEHAQADLQAATDGYDAARMEIESLQARVQEHVRSGKDWAMRVEALERTIDNLREENASLQQRDDDWHKEHSNALVEIARLKAAKADARHDTDDLTARDESQRIRIAELEAQLYAIGAGGVEPLRKRDCLHQIQEPDHFRGATKMVDDDSAVMSISLRQRADAWMRVCALLHELRPGWIDTGTGTAAQQALDAIRSMAAQK